MSSFKHKFYTIEDFIDLVKMKLDRLAEGYDPDYLYDVYGISNSDSKFRIGSQIYIADTPDFDDDDNEIRPAEVQLLGLSYMYSCDHFQDVVDLAFKQKPSATHQEVIEALNHYSKFDDFLDLS